LEATKRIGYLGRIFVGAAVAATVVMWLASAVAVADTHIPATTYSSNTTWTQAASPYILDGSVTVNSGATLTIQPGVVVKLNGTSRQISVAGTISAQGTAAAPVVFTSYKDDSVGGDSNGDGPSQGSPGDWLQVRVTGTGSFDYAEFRYGGWGSSANAYGALTVGGGQTTVDHSWIHQSQRSGVVVNQGTATVDRTLIEQGATGASVYNPGQLLLGHGSILRRNQLDGVWFNVSSCPPGASSVQDSDITANGRYGVYIQNGSGLAASCFPHGTNNNIYANYTTAGTPSTTTTGSELATIYGNRAVDWSGNFWGSDVSPRDNPSACTQTPPSVGSFLAHAITSSNPPPGPVDRSTYVAGGGNVVCYYDVFNDQPQGGGLIQHADRPPALGDPQEASCRGQQIECGQGADPVALATGALDYPHTDLELTGKGLPLAFSRTYNSGDASDVGLGPGWSYSGLITATKLASGDVVIRREDGRQDTFTQTQSGYTPPSGIHDTVVKNADGTFKLTTLDRTVYQFNGSGRVTSITDDHGLANAYSYDSKGRLASVTDPSSQSLSFTYSSNNHITKVSDSAGRSVTYAYDSAGNLSTVTDPLGGVTTYGYDPQYRLTQITDPAGHTYLTNTYDSKGRITDQRDGLGNHWTLGYSPGQTQVTEPEGGTQTYAFDAKDRLTARTDELGHTTTYGYDAAGNLTDIGRPAAANWHLGYDPPGNLTSIADPLGDQRSFAYDAQNRPTSYADARGKTWSYAWSPANDLTQVTDPKNQATSLTYNSAGKPLTLTDPKNHTTGFDYDSRGNLTSRTDPLGHTTSFGYDAYNNLTSLTRPGLGAETYERNALGDLLSVTTPPGNKTTYAYDQDGEPTQITDPALNVWRIDRNAMERPTQITDPAGNQIQIAYDGNLNPNRVTDRRGNATTYGYDRANQLTQVQLPGGETYGLAYDGRGNLTQLTDPLGRQRAYAYDLADRLTQVDEPLQTTTRYGYDANGELTSITDPRGNGTDLTYDELGQLTRIDQPLAKQTSFTYDPAGNLATRTTTAATLDFNYDAADRLTQVASGQNVLRGYGYDAADRLTQATDAQNKTIAIGWNGEDRATSIDDGRGQTVTRAYDSRGNLASQTDGRGTTTYAYDALDRITALTDPQGVAQSFHYNPEGALTEADLGNGAVTTNAYNSDGRLTQTRSQAGQTTLQSLDYGYDAAGRLTSQTDQSGQQTTYAYDALGRLTQFNPPGSPPTSYGYDAAGNRTQAGNTTYTYNALNQLTHSSAGTDYTYDGAGRLTRTTNGNLQTSYSWDPLNELTQVQGSLGATLPGIDPLNVVTGTISYTYDALGRRSERTDSAGTETAHYGDLTDAPILDTGSGGQIARSYLRGPGSLGADELLEQRADGATAYQLANGHGDVTAVLDASGQVASRQSYDPWGAQLSGPARQMGYLGAFERRTDPQTSLVGMGVRQYDPSQGRFLSEDPIVSAPGLGQSTDRYAYARDDPLDVYDLGGRFGLPSISVPSLPSLPSPGDLLGGIETGTRAVGNALDRTANAIGDAGSRVFNAARDAAASVGNAVADAANWVADRAHDIWKAIPDNAKTFGLNCGTGAATAATLFNTVYGGFLVIPVYGPITTGTAALGGCVLGGGGAVELGINPIRTS
jgi:RHS repeat-associated protein